MTGYVRVDVSNNIADGNVIAAADLDNEFDGVQAAFNASTGHTHDGTVGEGAAITKLGPTQDVTISASLLAPKTTNTVDLGSDTLRYKNLFLAGNASVTGTLGVTGVTTFTAQPVLSSLTASQAVFTNASKGLVSNAITGTGNVVMSNSPTLVTPALGTPSALVGTNITGTASGLTAGNVTTNANLTGAITSTGNATLLGSFSSANLAGALTDETGTGALVFANSPTLVTPALGTPASGVVTNLTGTASININGTVGATTASTGAFTTLAYTGTLTGGTGVMNLGSGQVFKDASGNVGIGTSSPAALLHISKATTGIVNLIVQNSENNNLNSARLSLASSSNQTRGGYVESILESGAGTGGTPSSIAFGTNAAFSTSTERMRITSAGNVGIGTSSPEYRLDLGQNLLGPSGTDSRFISRLSNVVNVKRKVATVSADTTLFDIQCGAATAATIGGFEITVFFSGEKTGVANRQYTAKWYVVRNSAGTFTIARLYEAGNSGAIDVVANGNSLNINLIFSVVNNGGCFAEIKGMIGPGNGGSVEAGFTVSLP